MNPGNEAGIAIAADLFAKAAKRIDGLLRMEFWTSPKDSTILWQMIEWRDESARHQAMSALFALPEMGLFSLYMATPPKRVGDFQKIC